MAGTVINCEVVKLPPLFNCCHFQSGHVTCWSLFSVLVFCLWLLVILVTDNIKEKSFDCQLWVGSFPYVAEQNTNPKIDWEKLLVQVRENCSFHSTRQYSEKVKEVHWSDGSNVVLFSIFMQSKASVLIIKKKSVQLWCWSFFLFRASSSHCVMG